MLGCINGEDEVTTTVGGSGRSVVGGEALVALVDGGVVLGFSSVRHGVFFNVFRKKITRIEHKEMYKRKSEGGSVFSF